MKSPLILVGLPRSGSTLLSRIINESVNCLMVNDFYYLQYVVGIDGYVRKDAEAKALMVDFITWQLRNRTKPDDLEDEIWFGLPFSSEQLETIDEFAEAYKADPVEKSWSEILEDIMQFATELAGKTMWGYNTPQDYLNAEQIYQAFPAATLLFLMRSPDRVLLSYKYYWTTTPKFHGDRGRYHPILQSLAWKTCAKSYLDLSAKYADRCFLVKFKDVVGDTDRVTELIERLTGVAFSSHVDISQFGHNSSLNKSGQNAKTLTMLERSICHALTQSQEQALGFDGVQTAKQSDPGLIRDMGDLIMTSARSLKYYLLRSVSSKDARKRVVLFARKVASS